MTNTSSAAKPDGFSVSVAESSSSNRRMHLMRERSAFATLSDAKRSRIPCIRRFNEDEKLSIFFALDVFALVSIAESFGIGYLEAWMSNKPVIGSRIGSTECVIGDGVDGTLGIPADPEEPANSVLQLLSDHDAREQMGRAGHSKTLAHFTWEKATDRVEQIYQNVHAQKKERGDILDRQWHERQTLP